MRVLVACEYSGTVRDAFLALGHDALSCDLFPTDVEGPHYQGDVRDIINDGWDLMIAHPPCTYLCSSGLHWNKPIQPWQFGHDASKATCLWLRGLPPLRPTEIIEPRWVCCGKAIPDTLGKYGCPNCCGDKKPKARWANQTDSGQNRLPPSEDRWKIRSLTYPGIAKAMAEQWGGQC